MQRTYPHKLLLWTILACRLFLKMVPSGSHLSAADAFGAFRQSLTVSSTPGASFSYSFDGVAIWYDCVFRTMQ